MNRDSARTRVVLALLLLTSFTLVTLDFRGDNGPLSGLRGLAAAIFGPIETTTAAVVRPFASVVNDVRGVGGADAEAERLRKENAELRSQLRTSDLARARANDLDKLLGLAGRGQYRVLPARVVAVGTEQGFEWTATIDAGTGDGIKLDMTVVNGDGLVGRVKRVGPMTSTILLAVDPTSSVGARLEGSLQIGVVTGRGKRAMDLQLLDPQTQVRKGDRLVTLGSQGSTPFVPGVPIGEVTNLKQTPGALTRTATVTPYVSFTALDLVGVVVEPPRKNPRDAVLPPPPPIKRGGQ
jgi:rod shape-determining protein MreC